ncbi:MAG: YbaN family protein [Planctomycetota bacterium]
MRLGINEQARVCPLRRHPVARAIWVSIGFSLLALGVVGILVPGWPTTIFVLLAFGSFLRGEPRLARWLNRHPVFGRFLRMARHGMPLSAKLVTLAVMWASAGASVWWMLSREEPLALPAAMTVAALTVGSVVLLRHKGQSEGEAPESCGHA